MTTANAAIQNTPNVSTMLAIGFPPENSFSN
jgi:hypothetical protein